MGRYLFVGLGNPGPSYENSRHNAGWIALDHLVKLWSDPSLAITWKLEKKIYAQVLRLSRGGDEIIMMKPQTFMNESGQAVVAAARWYLNLDPANDDQDFSQIVVFHDDLDIALGQYKLQLATGPKIHNGLNSVRNHLHSDKFWRARIGVDGRGGDRSVPGQAYVLQSFQPSEAKQLQSGIKTLSLELPFTVIK